MDEREPERLHWWQRKPGFTWLELIVVWTIASVASGFVKAMIEDLF